MSTLSKSSNFNPLYCGHVYACKNVQPIPNTDRISKCILGNTRVIVGREMKEGDLMYYFGAGCALSDSFLSNNNLYKDSSRNADPSKSGMFTDNTVRVKKLRGEYSFGIAIPVNEEAHDGTRDEAVFDMIDGEVVVKRALTKEEIAEMNRPAPKRRGIKRTKKSNSGAPQVVPEAFPMHYDTQMLADNMNMLFPESTIDISVKMHGTSVVIGKPLCLVKRNWISRLFHRDKYKYEYKYACASRNRIRGSHEDSIWNTALEVMKPLLRDGVIWYCEIVGYEPDGTPIQKGYDYGCKPGKFKIIPYRITDEIYMDQAYQRFEAPVASVATLTKSRQDIVPQLMPIQILYHGRCCDYLDIEPNETLDNWRTRLLEKLRNDQSFGMEQLEPLCNNKVPREGIVIRLTSQDRFATPMAYKLKTAAFWKNEL